MVCSNPKSTAVWPLQHRTACSPSPAGSGHGDRSSPDPAKAALIGVVATSRLEKNAAPGPTCGVRRRSTARAAAARAAIHNDATIGLSTAFTSAPYSAFDTFPFPVGLAKLGRSVTAALRAERRS
jgi:hypothetical protein